METGLCDKHILLAASSRGLGFSIAKQCVLEGAKVFIGSRSADKLNQAVDELRKIADNPDYIHGAIFDAREPESIEYWVKEAKSTHGPIYGLLTNAGGPPAGKFEDFDDIHWQQAFELTLLSTIRMIRLVLPDMKEQKKGSIVCITSLSVKESIDNLLLSNVIRSGVAGLVKSLSRDFSPWNIRVNNLIPGRIDTDRLKALDNFAANKLNKTAAEVRDAIQKTIPLGRYGDPNEFGKAGLFLLSDAASYINGETLIVDGGLSKSNV